METRHHVFVCEPSQYRGAEHHEATTAASPRTRPSRGSPSRPCSPSAGSDEGRYPQAQATAQAVGGGSTALRPAAKSGKGVHFGPIRCMEFEVGSSCMSMREASPASVPAASTTSTIAWPPASPTIAVRNQTRTPRAIYLSEIGLPDEGIRSVGLADVTDHAQHSDLQRVEACPSLPSSWNPPS